MGETRSEARQDGEFWRLVAKYRRGKRGHMLKALTSTARNSSEIADRIGIASNTAGCYLREAKREGLVKCVTPEADRYKMYVLTDKGHEVADEL